MRAIDDRRAAVLAQLRARPSNDVRAFVAYLATLNIDAVELPLAAFLADLAQRRPAAGPELIMGVDAAAAGEFAGLRDRTDR